MHSQRFLTIGRRFIVKVGVCVIATSVLLSPAIAGKKSAATREAVREDERVSSLIKQNRYDEALPLAQRALKFHEGIIRDPEIIVSLVNIAKIYANKRDYSRSKTMLLRAVNYSEDLLGSDNPNTAAILNELGLVQGASGERTEAERSYTRALEIVGAAIGPDSIQAADVLTNLGQLLQDEGRYFEAESRLERAENITEKKLGLRNTETIDSINLLGAAYINDGAYSKAVGQYKRAVDLRLAISGRNDINTAESLNNLGYAYEENGESASAEAVLLDALKIREHLLGKDHPTTSTTVNNLGNVYNDMGDYTLAEAYFKRALKIREKSLGPRDWRTSTSANNLGMFYLQKPDYDRAIPLLKGALANREEKSGHDHPDTAMMASNLASAYMEIGQYSEAERLYTRALAIETTMLGPAHPVTGLGMMNLGSLAMETGNFARAEEYYLQATAIESNAVGAAHPYAIAALENLGVAEWSQSKWNNALKHFQDADDAQEAVANAVYAVGDERRKEAYAQSLASTTDSYVTFSLAGKAHVSGAVSLGMQAVLRRKGRVLDILSDRYATLRSAVSPDEQKTFVHWREVNARYAALVFRGIQNSDSKQYTESLASIKAEMDSLASQIVRGNATIPMHSTDVTIDAVSNQIPEDSVLIEWYLYRPFKPDGGNYDRSDKKTRYAAYLVRKQGPPDVVDVGDSAEIGADVAKMLAALRYPCTVSQPERTCSRGRIERANGSAAEPDFGAAGRELYRRVWEPLLPYLRDSKKVFIAPDGQLNLIPFGALIDSAGKYLIESTELTYFTSGRDLLRTLRVSRRNAPVAIFADPLFGTADDTAPHDLHQTANRRSGSMRIGTLHFGPLPGTRAEAIEIQKILGVPDSQVFLGEEATVTTVKALQSPKILHLATHGFFMEDQSPERTNGIAGRSGTGTFAMPVGENPFLRSGLALAGANLLDGADDDGILTALEVAGLDLASTQLVVLSACETGVGEVHNGDGVFGLRRALILAGAHTAILSLWKVDDDATKDLMSDYYRSLSHGTGRSAALRDAQLAQLRIGNRSHPYYWASFVTVGAWGPLD